MSYVYKENYLKGCGVKLDFENKKAWAKYPDYDEFEVDWDTQTVSDAIVNGSEISESEYTNYTETD